MKKIGIIFLLSLAGIGHLFAETLTIQIENVDIGKGQILVGIYNDEKAFPDPDKYFTNSEAEAGSATVTVAFPDLPKGIYVVAVYQDKNGNGKLDKFLGIPKEKYGFSNNTMMPDWKKNSFELNADTGITIKLR